MSFQLMAWAVTQRTGSPTRKAVLMALANRANHDTGRCFPSVATIAAETELSEPTVKRALVDLADKGLVARSRRRRADGTHSTYEYTFPAADQVSQRSEPEITVTPSPEITVIPLNQEEEPSNLEGNQEEPFATEVAVIEYDPRKGVAINGHNLPWDALVEATHADQIVEAGKIGSALKRIRGFMAPTFSPQQLAEPEGCERLMAKQIHARARLYRGRWPNIDLTPTALASNWARVTAPMPGGDAGSALEAAERGLQAGRS